MLNWIKWLFISLLILGLVAGSSVFFVLNQSLPQLEGTIQADGLSAEVSVSRDTLGQAVIHADSRSDAVFALGFAHGQDRFFQMDLQRRAAAGELSQWLGERALEVDKRARFHQFRKRAQLILADLTQDQRSLLQRYADGVNLALERAASRPFEYWITFFDPQPWTPEDSLLVIFSMYMDLQLGQVKLDLARTGVIRHFGQEMLAFLNSPSQYQAALDGSTLPPYTKAIPSLSATATAMWEGQAPPDIGSNNWAVSKAFTGTQSAMLANDMHLGLRVPIIWYRAQLNYAVTATRDNSRVQVTGVTLPGLPGVVVGTNGSIAWGFTNANLDNVDWVALGEDDKTWQVNEQILLPDDSYNLALTMSEYGPVRIIDGQAFALKWVAHERFAVNLDIMDLDTASTTEEALDIARTIRIPVQNMVIADAAGKIAWRPAGAVVARPTPSPAAIAAEAVDKSGWQQPANDLPVYRSPAYPRIWTANARVISAQELERYGDGGYALGARASQIKDRLMAKARFDEQDFYAIQLDNEARFLLPWHKLLVSTLQQSPAEYEEVLEALANWQACACADSVGYTLVKAFRADLINRLLSPVFTRLETHGFEPAGLLRQVEPAIWRLLNEQPDSWLPAGADSWQQLRQTTFDQTLARLLKSAGPDATLASLSWGNVNELQVNHPFSATLEMFAGALNMPAVQGFGDTFMPAVQSPSFGASQRFFIQPGHLENAILTLPGGQSGHPLSSFYQTGFADYANNESTPLLPGNITSSLTLTPESQ